MNTFLNLQPTEAIAVITEEQGVLSYKSLLELADSIASSLDANDLIAIECDNSPFSLAAYLGALRRRVPAILIDSKLDSERKRALYDHYQVSSVFLPEQRDWTRLTRSGPDCHPDLALLLSTSGSTGSPKLVRLSIYNLESNAEQIANYLGLNSHDRAITILPQHYSFGLSIINTHLLKSGSVALTNRSLNERGFWNLFQNARPTSVSGVPTTFEQLKRLRFNRMELPSLRMLTQAGGKMNPSLVSEFASLSKSKEWSFFVMYGQTEATARISYLPPDLVLTHPDSIGVPVPGGKIELVDQVGQRILSSHTIGELVYSGPNVMMGYAESADDLRIGDEQKGVLKTGDLGEFDNNGLFYIRGRAKRFVKVFGNRINLDEIGTFLKDRDLDVVVCGQDDLIVICSTSPEHAAAGSLLIQQTFRINRLAVKPFSVNTLPLSSGGKILYNEILQRFLELNGAPG